MLSVSSERTSTIENVVGRRIHVIGNSCSGKSTLAAQLAATLDIPLVELDALNWLPGWVGLNETDPAEFERRIREATSGDAWVVAGSYAGFARRLFWDRLETVVWLDLSMPLLLRRVIARSWRRWRSRELLWGTNHESFWRQLMVWKKEDSLVWWIVTHHEAKRRAMRAARADPAWSHIRFIHLTSPSAVREFVASIESAPTARDTATIR
jgi:adenylate kinase family enzyme